MISKHLIQKNENQITNNGQTNNKLRDSSIELLRVIAMFMIIFHHIAINAGNFTDNLLYYNFIIIGGKIGVNLFILISGYYLIQRNNIKLEKVLKLYLQVFLYSTIIYVIFLIFNHANIGNLYTYIFPLTNQFRRFFSIYFVLYLLHPILNKGLHSLNKDNYKNILKILILARIIIPIYFPTGGEDFSNQLLWFMSLYAIGGYIKLHTDLNQDNYKKYLRKGIEFLLLNVLINALIIIIENKNFNGMSLYIKHAVTYQKPYNFLILASSIYLFLAFQCKKIKYNKSINILGSTVLGIYLIHEHPLIKYYLYKKRFHIPEYPDFYIMYTIIIAITIFSSCALIDIFRQKFIEKPIFKYINNNSEKIKTIYNKLLDKIKVFGEPLI